MVSDGDIRSRRSAMRFMVFGVPCRQGGEDTPARRGRSMS